MSHLHIRLEERGLGPYTARVEVLDDILAKDPAVAGEVSLRDLYTLRLHIDNAIAGLEHRHMVDAVCGPCALCDNTRMELVERHGRMTQVHCSVCKPLIDAAEDLMRTGL